jgi:hypothetical protein
MRATQIAEDKISAYRATDYRLGHDEQSIVLRIGQRCDLLAPLFASRSVDCGAFLTAYNPRGSQQADAENDRSHAQLAARLGQLGLEAIEGSGSEEGSNWPAERSYFALGLTLEAARQIGKEFDQDAIVWVGADAVPELILLR